LLLSDRFKAGDAVVGGILLFSALLGFIFMLTAAYKGGISEVEIIAPDFEARYSLDSDLTLEVKGVTVVIENGCVYVSDSDCDDKICVNTGRISRSGQSVVCLPKKVSVRIVNVEDDIIVAG